MDKLPITQTLRALEIGESTQFPRIQYRSIAATMTALKIQENLHFQMKINADSITITKKEI